MEVLGKNAPYGQIFTNVFQSPTCGHGNTSFCANFVKSGRPEVGDNRALFNGQKQNKISACAPAALFCADRAQNLSGTAPNNVLGVPKFHPNPFTSGGVIAERVNIVQTPFIHATKCLQYSAKLQLLRRVINTSHNRATRLCLDSQHDNLPKGISTIKMCKLYSM